MEEAEAERAQKEAAKREEERKKQVGAGLKGLGLRVWSTDSNLGRTALTQWALGCLLKGLSLTHCLLR